MLTGNKGEWSEIYALFKLLGEKTIFAGDADLNKIESLFYPIIKIIRSEAGGNYEYEVEGHLILIKGNEEQLRIPVSAFSQQAASLLEHIKKSSGTFSLPETEQFMTSVKCKDLKAKSTTKSDITIVIHDPRANQTQTLGFSIKSQLGSESTLLNAGRTTNFIYSLSNFQGIASEVERINSIETRSKIKDRLKAINILNGSLTFFTLEHSIFKNNLILIDTSLPNILSEIIKLFFTSDKSSIKGLTEEITRVNPLGFEVQHSHSFYEHKIKRFLTDVALGMMPSKVWNGQYEATGGYLVVKEDGEILCYHIYNKNQFEEYLYSNTKLETASSTRHEFGTIYEENGKLFFKLNLQIRFK